MTAAEVRTPTRRRRAPATNKKKAMGKRRREQLNADAERLQVQRLGELVDRANTLLLSDLPAQYQAAFDQPLRTESKLRKYLEGLDGFELCEGDKPGTHCLRRKALPTTAKEGAPRGPDDGRERH